MRKLSWTLLLPFLLLFVQQGEWRHAFGHDSRLASSCAKAPAEIHHCPGCLAFAQIGGAASAEGLTPALLSGLSFSRPVRRQVASADGDPVTARSRGPPVL